MALEKLTEPAEFEKYVAPGAALVTLWWIFPRVLLRGVGLQEQIGVGDIASLFLISYFAGHILEALKVYSLPEGVRDNLKTYRTLIEQLLRMRNIQNIDEKLVEDIQASLFTVVNPAEHAEVTFNLVRWQKMIVFRLLFMGSGIIWIGAGILTVLERKQNFRLFSFSLASPWLNPDLGLPAQLVIEVAAAILSFLVGHIIYNNGKQRQEKTNRAQYELIVKHFSDIIAAVRPPEPTSTK